MFSTYFPASIADIENSGLAGILLTGKGCEFNFDLDAPRDLTKCGIYVACLNAAGTALTAWKVLSGPGLSDNFNSIGGMTVGNLDDVYVTGTLPTTPGAAQAASAGSSDAFVVRFDFGVYGVTVKFVTYLGGSASDGAAGIAQRQAFVPRGGEFRAEQILAVAGWTSSHDFPVTAGAFQTTRGGDRDVFVATLDPWTGKPIAAT